MFVYSNRINTLNSTPMINKSPIPTMATIFDSIGKEILRFCNNWPPFLIMRDVNPPLNENMSIMLDTSEKVIKDGTKALSANDLPIIAPPRIAVSKTKTSLIMKLFTKNTRISK